MLRTAIEGLWIEAFNLNADEVNRHEATRRCLIVTIWFFVSLLIALFIPNITVVIDYLGALAATFMFIFPGIYMHLINLSNLCQKDVFNAFC